MTVAAAAGLGEPLADRPQDTVVARPPLARVPVGSAVLATVAVLLATNGQYGYHRDELYFRMLRPAWGYVDQPPLTPLLAHAAIALLGDTVWAIRVPGTICVAVAVLLTALTTRELGGGRTAQALSAWGFGFAGFPMVTGHILLTADVDLVVWAGLIFCLVRALLRDRPAWWLGAGGLVGLGLFNKFLIVVGLVGVLVGLLVAGPRRAMRSGWLWAGAGLALVIGSPNLIYQASHDWPQWTMAGVISADKGPDTRVQLLPFQLLLVGLPLVPVWLAGFVALWRRPIWRAVRWLPVAYLTVLLLVLVTGGQVYYPFGLLGGLFAAGCVPAADWLARRPGVRGPLLVGAVAVNAVLAVLIALPVVPLDRLGRTPIPAINQGARDQVGWPVYVARVAAAYRALPPADRAAAVLYAGNYGEAGALARYGPAEHLPAVYSAHNELVRYGPPPASATIAVAWVQDPEYVRGFFAGCTEPVRQDNGVGVTNEEQDSVVMVCRNPVGGWAAIWPRLQHLG